MGGAPEVDGPRATGARYDAFLSYAHSDDDDGLVTTLQATMASIAKPWYRRRALRVFRDATALSASPGLWSSITGSIEGADWFVLVASPAAAASEWVDKEVDHWVRANGTDRLLVVLVGGEWSWDDTDGDFSTHSTAVPPSLRGAFEEEPRHIDVCWAAETGGVQASDPRWRDQVAELVAPIHGLSKEDVEGADLRAHRRTVRAVRIVAAVLGVLALTASVAAVVAVRNADESRRNAERATIARDDAEFRRLVAQAQDLRRSRRDLALLLAVEARHLQETPESNGAVLTTIMEDPRLLGIVGEDDVDGYFDICPVPGTPLVVTGGRDGTFGLFDLDTGERRGERRTVSAGDEDTPHPTDPPGSVGCSVGSGGGPVGVVFTPSGTVLPLDMSTMTTGDPVRLGMGLNQVVASPDGRWIAAGTSDGRLVTWATDAPSERTVTEVSDGTSALGVAFSPDGRSILTAGREALELRRVGTWVVDRTFPSESGDQGGGLVALPEVGRFVEFTSDARHIVDGRRGVDRVHDAATGDVLWSQPNNFASGRSARLLPDGAAVLMVGDDGTVLRRRIADGTALGDPIRSPKGTETSIVPSADGSELLAASFRTGTIERWSLIGDSAIGDLVAPGEWRILSVAPDGSSMALGAPGVSTLAAGEVRGTTDGELLGPFPEAAFPTMLDRAVVGGFFLERLAVDQLDVTTERFLGPGYPVVVEGVVRAFATDRGEVVVAYDDRTLRRFHADGTEVGDPFATLDLLADSNVTLSPDGDLVGATSVSGAVVVLDRDGRELWRADGYLDSFSADGTVAAVVDLAGQLQFRDSRSGEIERVAAVDASSSYVSLVGGPFVFVSNGRDTQVYDEATLRPIGEPVPGIDLAFPLDEGRRLATVTDEGIVVLDIDPDAWERAACEMAGRNLTPEERAEYLPAGRISSVTCPQWPPG